MSSNATSADIAIIGMSVRFAGAENPENYWHDILHNAWTNNTDPARPCEDALSLLQELLRGALDDAGDAGPSSEHKSLAFMLSVGPACFAADLNAGRIAAALNFTGPESSFSLNCASPLQAIAHARQALRKGDYDLALAGGFQARASNLSQNHAASPVAPCEEGGAFLVLKRLPDAMRDGDRIYAVIRGAGAFSVDGPDELPKAHSEKRSSRSLERVYGESGVDPSTVELVEICATGSGAGFDPDALQSLLRLFGKRRGPIPRCGLGLSAGPVENYSHAAGAAGVVKIALALYHKVLPPTRRDDFGPALDDFESPFYLNTQVRPWIHGRPATPRRAAISDYGPAIEGHVVLEECKADENFKLLERGWPTELLLFSGADRESLLASVRHVSEFIRTHPEAPLANLAFTLSTGPRRAHRLAIIARDPSDLLAKLEVAIEKLSDPQQAHLEIRSGIYYAERATMDGPSLTAFLFPGYGSYYAGMLADLCRYLPDVREWFDALDQIFGEMEGPLPSQQVFPPPPGLSDAAKRELARGLHDLKGGAQGGFTATLALYELLRELGLRCDVMVGHSNGENAALIASGTIRYRERRELFEIIGRITLHDARAEAGTHIPKGALLGVSSTDDGLVAKLIAAYSGRLYVAMDNCPRQVVLFADESISKEVTRRIAEAGGICVRLPFERAYHTPLYEAQADTLRTFYDSVDIGPGNTRVYSCASGLPFPSHREEICALALKQWSSPVRFRQTIERLYSEGIRTFIEVGPNNILTSFVDDTLRDKEYIALSANNARRAGLEQLQYLLAQLYVNGLEPDLSRFFKYREVSSVSLEAAASESKGPLSRIEVGVGQPSERLEILHGHFALMEDFMQSQSRMMSEVCEALAFAGGFETPLIDSPSAHEEAGFEETGDWPLLGKILESSPQRLYAERCFDLESDPFLRDHTFGRKMSGRHPELLPLPVLPFTVSMEILAQAASCMMRGRRVAHLHSMRGYRWFSLDRGALKMGILAELKRQTIDAGPEIHVRLFDLGAELDGARQLAFEGHVRLAERFEEPPSPEPFNLARPAPARLSAAEFYSRYAFHGPCFQTIKRATQWSDEGIEAVLTVPALEDFFRDVRHPVFQIPASLLDTAGQLVSLWHVERGVRAFPVFPFKARAFRQFGTPPPSGSEVLCRCLVQMNDKATAEADFEFLDQTGRVIARLEGFQLRNYHQLFVTKFFKTQTFGNYFSDAGTLPQPGLTCRRMDVLTANFLDESWGIWKRVLAHATLNEREREEWYRLPERGPRRRDWVMGRAAAKDAVRQWAHETYNLDLALVDVEIASDERRRPLVKCAELEALGPVPDISISHSGGHVLAAVCAPGQRVGIDLERLDQERDYDAIRAAFTDRELALAGDDGAQTLLGLWCAREAAAKALGTGLLGEPGRWRVTGYAADEKGVRITHRGKSVPIRLWLEDDEVIATCLIPARIARSSNSPATEFPVGQTSTFEYEKGAGIEWRAR